MTAAHLILGGVLIAAVFGAGVYAIEAFALGAKVTSSTLVSGTVQESPEELRAAASAKLGREISLEVYCLARMVASENGGDAGLENACRMWAAWNDSQEHGWSILFTVTATSAKNAALKGTFGKQGVRRYSTARDPREGHVQLAEATWAAIQRGDPDPSKGADGFANRGAMGVQEGSPSWDDFVARRDASGYELYNVEGVTNDLYFQRRRVA